eukprot:TRINITY_DN92385_c0_g1_i1.p1 TRINITY_DN92385_c0_g1~~TRINITY_DN92385_c0_g1_i1.p1  ORF type:complete len:444 (+),score=97.22 TRINITY_DN92385_c0_g1_i1:59-1390(+)
MAAISAAVPHSAYAGVRRAWLSLVDRDGPGIAEGAKVAPGLRLLAIDFDAASLSCLSGSGEAARKRPLFQSSFADLQEARLLAAAASSCDSSKLCGERIGGCQMVSQPEYRFSLALRGEASGDSRWTFAAKSYAEALGWVRMLQAASTGSCGRAQGECPESAQRAEEVLLPAKPPADKACSVADTEEGEPLAYFDDVEDVHAVPGVHASAQPREGEREQRRCNTDELAPTNRAAAGQDVAGLAIALPIGRKKTASKDDLKEQQKDHHASPAAARLPVGEALQEPCPEPTPTSAGKKALPRARSAASICDGPSRKLQSVAGAANAHVRLPSEPRGERRRRRANADVELAKAAQVNPHGRLKSGDATSAAAPAAVAMKTSAAGAPSASSSPAASAPSSAAAEAQRVARDLALLRVAPVNRHGRLRSEPQGLHRWLHQCTKLPCED